ncbi:NUDIX hydrolase [Paracoccus sp. p4-l81]|uniref:NUDIX hydrolase n=1 Tax=unclassified Paracoccus (in: a-proteobacteria) TaxID=2688777 RepID=UPI0035BA662A
MPRLHPVFPADLPTDVHGQFAALCWRRAKVGHQVLLITSRDTGRWVLPKGWPIPGLAPHAAAAQEAWEEAGVEGRAAPDPIGFYSYQKLGANRARHVVAAVFALKVKKLARDFPESGQRRLKWFRPEKAATKVAEPELAALLAAWQPEG